MNENGNRYLFRLAPAEFGKTSLYKGNYDRVLPHRITLYSLYSLCEIVPKENASQKGN